MTVGVIIPVGPGHEDVAREAVASVERAWRTSSGPFTRKRIVTVPDPQGELGRSAARNWGMDACRGLDWHFLLDADDWMVAQAFSRVDTTASATFGAISLDGVAVRRNRWPVDRNALLRHGTDGTVCMGCFVKGDLGVRFDESLDNGEDFDFYMRLPDFIKVKEPLVDIRYSQDRRTKADRHEAGWREACERAIDRYREVVT